jgi:hypothetical protein
MTSNRFAFRVNHLERLPLRTPYTVQLARLLAIKSRLPRSAQLIMDITGVGKGLFDMAVSRVSIRSASSSTPVSRFTAGRTTPLSPCLS